MSRHIPRSERWTKLGPNEYRSATGSVRFHKGAWWAWFSYRVCDPTPPDGGLLAWEDHTEQLGPFKRPRNAMIAAEDQILWLQRKHGECLEIVVNDQASGGR
jgi:hypothetical protein